MEIIKLIGVLIVVIGFILKFRYSGCSRCGRSCHRTGCRHESYGYPEHTGHRIYHQPYCHPFHPYTAGDRTV